MTDPDTRARNRYLAIVASRIAGSAGAVLGVILVARAATLGPKLIGVALVLAALWVTAIVPASLARRWRTPPDA